MNRKAIIRISDKDYEGNPHKFSDEIGSELAGKNYIDVDLTGHNYGAGSPCLTEEEVNNTIEHYQKIIEKEGDVCVLDDFRKRQATLEEFK